MHDAVRAAGYRRLLVEIKARDVDNEGETKNEPDLTPKSPVDWASDAVANQLLPQYKRTINDTDKSNTAKKSHLLIFETVSSLLLIDF